MTSQRSFILALLLLSACSGSEPVSTEGEGSTTPPYVRPEVAPLNSARTEPIRVGEMGPSFAACNARGTVRERVAAGSVAVRAAPYQQQEAIDELQPGAEFFICSRTQDQRWFGIVYDEGGVAAERCGVARPIAERRAYQGPCAAGWVSSHLVRLISGVPHQLTAPTVDGASPAAE